MAKGSHRGPDGKWPYGFRNKVLKRMAADGYDGPKVSPPWLGDLLARHDFDSD
jgi:hypothetical protein